MSDIEVGAEKRNDEGNHGKNGEEEEGQKNEENEDTEERLEEEEVDSAEEASWLHYNAEEFVDEKIETATSMCEEEQRRWNAEPDAAFSFFRVIDFTAWHHSFS